MKKRRFLISVLASLALLAGCASDNNTAAEVNAATFDGFKED